MGHSRALQSNRCLTGKPCTGRKPCGQSLPEYALALALVTIACIATLRLLGQSFTQISVGNSNSLSAAIAQAMAAL